MDVHDALRGTYVPLAAIASEVREDIKERFATRTGPDGAPWDEWSDNYELAAMAYTNIGMLRRDDWLYEAVTGPDAIVVTNDTLFFNETAMANIPISGDKEGGEMRGFWHQEGLPDRKARGGADNPLPARPFLGLTEETRVFVLTAFEEWFNKAIMLFPKKGGGTGQRHALQGVHPVTGHRGFIPRAAGIPIRLRRR